MSSVLSVLLTLPFISHIIHNKQHTTVQPLFPPYLCNQRLQNQTAPSHDGLPIKQLIIFLFCSQSGVYNFISNPARLCGAQFAIRLSWRGQDGIPAAPKPQFLGNAALMQKRKRRTIYEVITYIGNGGSGGGPLRSLSVRNNKTLRDGIRIVRLRELLRSGYNDWYRHRRGCEWQGVRPE